MSFSSAARVGSIGLVSASLRDLPCWYQREKEGSISAMVVTKHSPPHTHSSPKPSPPPPSPSPRHLVPRPPIGPRHVRFDSLVRHGQRISLVLQLDVSILWFAREGHIHYEPPLPTLVSPEGAPLLRRHAHHLALRLSVLGLFCDPARQAGSTKTAPAPPRFLANGSLNIARKCETRGTGPTEDDGRAVVSATG